MKTNFSLFVFAFGLITIAVHGQVVIDNITYAIGPTTVTDAVSISASTSVVVPSGASVTYSAGSVITLSAGFDAQPGSYFHAFLPATAPTLLQGSVSGGTTATLSWGMPGGSSDFTSYQIFCNGSLIGSVGASTFAFTDTGLVPGSTYNYSVVALSPGGGTSPAANLTLVLPDLEVFTPIP